MAGQRSVVRIFRAPGRVNLIGEHTDYNLGFVLPMALELETTVSSAPAVDGKLHIYSESRGEKREWDLDAIGYARPSKHWSDYPLGVAQQLIRAGYRLEPADLRVRSTVPEGGGLSSSAALEVSSALAFLNGRSMPRIELALLCQRAEREFVGLPSGIMDQYISVTGGAVRIDCRSLEGLPVRLPQGVAFVAVNSMVKHDLAASAYHDRVRECAEAAAALGVASLRDAKLVPGMPKRARHVVTENMRVEQFVAASERSDVAEMGSLMIASHRSLREDYEVSSEELDFLVETALDIDGVYGSRMTGGGFGGCTVSLLREDAVERFGREIAAAYERRFRITPAIYRCVPGSGAGEITGA